MADRLLATSSMMLTTSRRWLIAKGYQRCVDRRVRIGRLFNEDPA
jgi:hypothetical protein